ncbi:nitrate respiration regulation response regulator NreC [Mammaliicoccus sciuri]|uniref:nitrate respiration regulation response regulator NreC n=1 Tax=Mammaliicoccus sciuri TaxID=1296 RepID=UPI0021D1AA1D|nr:nitrate respiration regulation response regulator NreC [Mammaliicoccus sciuri]UXV32902.1 response regulator transcription factor [Mammaliicoccus sciuri]
MKIVIADDHAVVRTGFSMILNYQEDMEVVATAADGIEAYQMVAKHSPDVLIMDLSMPPGESGLIATGKIAEDFKQTKILILTMFDDEELIHAVRTIYRGDMYIDSKVTSSLVNELFNHQGNNEQSTSDPFKILSQRELEILPLIAKGYGNKEIAEKLFVSVKTIEAHKARIMDKLGLKSRPELVEYAMKKKLLDF